MINRRKVIIGPILIAAAFIIFQYLGSETYQNPETGEKVRVATSTEQEAQLGLQSYQEVLSQSHVIDSGEQYEMVNRVAEKLINVVDEKSKEFEWSVSLVDDSQKNAFCLPGGKIVVYTGILSLASTDDALAAVMGHEIAHATARHGGQRLFKQQMVQTALMGISGSTAEMDPRQRQVIMGLIGAGAQYGLILPYGRKHELEADELGLYYLIRAGYDPNAAVEFWQKMEESTQKQPPEWASTHPSHGSRIQRLQELISKIKLDR